jgi:transglutaminase-like putative cysteine protease
MTTTQRMRPVSTGFYPKIVNRWRRRLRNQVRTVFARGDISSLIMVWSLMLITALALRAAHWTDGLGALSLVSFFAVGFGFLLARSHYSELMALILSTIYSMLVVAGASALMLVESGSFRERIITLSDELSVWFNQALAGDQPSNDSTVFVIFLSVLFWYLGHNAAWHVFRVDRVWRVIIPCGLVLIGNQFYYQGNTSLDGYLIGFLLVSLLLLIRSHIDTREFDWYLHRVHFPNHVRRTFFQAGGMIALVVVLVAWIVPAGTDDKSLDRLNDLLSGEPLAKLADLWNRLFSSLEAEGIATADYYGGDELQLSGAIQLGDQPVMVVDAPFGPRYYWRSTIYDTYDSGSWTWKHIRSVRAYTDEEGLRLNPGAFVAGARRDVQQTFTMLLRATRLVYAAPQPIQMGLPVEAELDCVEDYGRACINENRQSDVAIIQARKTLRTGDSYNVMSSISMASADELRSASLTYPDWVLRLYLQGAGDVRSSVRDLAAQIVGQAGSQTPYDKSKAIERWLRTNIQYNESIPVPPQDSDPVEWFLFEAREGYCNYYATAMIVMLRSQGIPARMAAGFAQGTWDPERNGFLVRERDAHTWVEVYFPGYGWVEFEPTADEAPLDREGDQLPQTSLPTITPMPTATFTPTFTPTPLPPAPAGANATPTSTVVAPFIPSTPTPIVPSPSPTAPPPPEVTKVDSDSGSSILKTILMTLGIFVLVIVLLVLFVVFLIWYVEYRGLGGLNPIQRAYARLSIYGNWIGLHFDRSATPDERRRFMIGELPEGEKPINFITRTYIQERYDRPDKQSAAAEQSQAAQEAWREARSVFIRRMFGRRRGGKSS